MMYEKPKLRYEIWEEEEDVLTASLEVDKEDEEDPWTGGEGGNVNDNLW